MAGLFGEVIYSATFVLKTSDVRLPSFLALQGPALRSWMRSQRPMVGSFSLANCLDLGSNKFNANSMQILGPLLPLLRILRPKHTSVSSASSAKEFVSSEFCREGVQMMGSAPIYIDQKIWIWIWRYKDCTKIVQAHLRVQDLLSCRERGLRGGVRTTDRAKRSFSPQFGAGPSQQWPTTLRIRPRKIAQKKSQQ